MSVYHATDDTDLKSWDELVQGSRLTDTPVEYDAVDNPKHYTDKSIEVIDYIEDTVPDPYSFYMGNVLKYVSRHLNKSGKQDLLKAKYYLERMIDDYT